MVIAGSYPDVLLKAAVPKGSTWDELKKQGSSHYKTSGIEPVDLYRSGGMFCDFALCSIIKYAFRSRCGEGLDMPTFHKNMDKIIDYAQKLKAAFPITVEG